MKKKNKTSDKNVKFIQLPNRLKQKVGSGGIDPRLIQKAQKFIDGAKTDFKPFAQEFLNQIANAIKDHREGKTDQKQGLEAIVVPVMELKANGAMFNYYLITDISRGLLYFLECLEKLDEDSFAIVEVHTTALQTILKNEVRGNTGKEGIMLLEELQNACKRYYSKHNIDPAMVHKRRERNT